MPAEIAQAVAAVEAETHRETQGNLPAFKQSFAYQPFLKFASPPQRKRTLNALQPTQPLFSTSSLRSGPKKVVTAEELDADLDAYNTNKVRPFKR